MAKHTKRCGRCHAKKPTVCFNHAAGRRDGLYGFCKDCVSNINRKRYKANPEIFKEKTRKNNLRPEVIKRKHEQSKKDYWEHRDLHLSKVKEWMRTHRKQRREYVREWNRKNVELVRSYQKKHKARKRGAGRASVTAAMWQLIKETFRNQCVYCGKKGHLEQDHLVPLSSGGQHIATNIVPACRHCNATKLNNAPPAFWWTA